MDNSRPLYRYENNARTTPGHQKRWKRRGFHVCIGTCMTGECIREGQWQLRLKAVVRGMVICLRWQKVVVARQVCVQLLVKARLGYSGDSGGGGGNLLARLLV
eukprot:scaffold22545_cov61-Attheya_sp.AAC.5